ncbi:hypothetical protein ACN42_g7816 [Penicillium freii]|uniref:Uncharacterized protein n=1 Tax=Penicillium freii TaxID=48697 RepID=A0A101MEW4_PENFR|nr:hypothetical protein ACN42_g7816 [Penicillium freii]
MEKVTETNLKFHRSCGEEAPRKKMSVQKRTGSRIISQAQDDLMKARCAACIYPTAFHLVPRRLGALVPGIVMYRFVQFNTGLEVLSDFSIPYLVRALTPSKSTLTLHMTSPL